MFVDTHCHLYQEYYEVFDEVIDKIKKAPISKVINNGCDRKSNKEVLTLAGQYDFIYCSLGIHPENVDTYAEEDLDFIEKHIQDKKVVAIGEIGLDYHYTKENKKEQIILFERQLALAEKYHLPVIVHSRDATMDTINSLKKYHVRGVIHSFSGSYETACIYIKMGFLLGINGVITFKNCQLKDIYEKISLENIVLETDAPYLTPEPFRGKKNDSTHIIEIAKFVCELKDISMEELSLVTNENVLRLFDI